MTDYMPIEKGDYCPLNKTCVGEDCPFGVTEDTPNGRWKNNGCSIYNKAKENSFQ